MPLPLSFCMPLWICSCLSLRALICVIVFLFFVFCLCSLVGVSFSPFAISFSFGCRCSLLVLSFLDASFRSYYLCHSPWAPLFVCYLLFSRCVYFSFVHRFFVAFSFCLVCASLLYFFFYVLPLLLFDLSCVLHVTLPSDRALQLLSSVDFVSVSF